MRRIAPASIAALCIANGIVAALTVALELNSHDVMRIFWVETGVIGLYTALKIGLAKETGLVGRTKPYKIVLFGAHYGTFWVFYTQLLSYVGRGHHVAFWLVMLAFVVFALAHGVTFKFATWDSGELRTVSSFAWMAVPYGRVIPLHAILLALHLGTAFVDVTFAALLLVGTKFVLDAPAHAFEHRWITPHLAAHAS